MLKVIKDLKHLNFGAIMDIYTESNEINAAALFSDASANEAMFLEENRFYQYLKEDFFSVRGSFYAVWEEQGKWISALRMEPYKDGMLLEGLETHPAYRGKGFAKLLVRHTLDQLPANTNVYSHVEKCNRPSLTVHQACGFQKILDHALFIDGSINFNSLTMLFVSR